MALQRLQRAVRAQLQYASAHSGDHFSGVYQPEKSTTWSAVTRYVANVAGGNNGDSCWYSLSAAPTVSAR
jgi:hypothetical protein